MANYDAVDGNKAHRKVKAHGTGTDTDPLVMVQDIEGVSREEKQDVGNDHLAAINGKLPILNNGNIPATIAAQVIDLRVIATGNNAPKSGRKSVAAAGTREALGASQVYKRLVVIADDTNTGYIYLGDSTVNSSNGIRLPAGGFFTFYFVNAASVHIDSDVSGEGVSFGGEV